MKGSIVSKCWLICLAVTSTAPALAGPESDPFYIADRSPLIVNSGLPGTESAQLLGRGQHSIGLFVDIASHASEANRANEFATLDGETNRVNLRLRYGASENWQLGMDLVWLSHGEGFLDSPISDWHDAFGLTEGDRDDLPNNRLLYYYEKDGQVLLDHQEDSGGMGDLHLNLAYQITSEPGFQLAVRGGVEFGTGDAEDLLGSDSTDFYLELAASKILDSRDHALTLHGGVGLLMRGEGKILHQEQEDWAGYSFLALDWGFSDAIHLKAQLNGHTSLYDAEVGELDSASIQLILGGTIRTGRNWLLDLSFGEDLLGETPDITFQMGIRYQLSGN